MGHHDNSIAIVGMAARFPGARTIDEFWYNLRSGIESVRALSEEELREAGVTSADLNREGYVRAAATLDGMELFDAEFFGFSPLEAAIMDPQHRQFLEATWEALEDAGHPPDRFDGAIGVFAGCGMNSYFIHNVLSNTDLVRDVGLFLLRHTGNDKDFLATRASYLLDLQGPSINVQTACSTSLVATHLACQHLLSGECDLALAGGSTIELPHGHGYQYIEGEILSPDGHCRAFDHRSEGTVFGSGAGVVALRRLQDALDDGDRVYAVITASAVNNDGSRKVGYLAPSVDGQAACIAEAMGVAAIDAESMSYVECHGTGTPMGDPIEVAALTQAFRQGTQKSGFCAIGSVKSNIGHLDTAAGVASLIKVALSLRNAEIPPTLHFEAENPALELKDSPFFVNDRLREWRQEGTTPRRAGVNSLGVGGTNAFVIMEEAPARSSSVQPQTSHLLMISARTRAALDANALRLGEHLRAHPDIELGDVAWTLRHGRRAFRERRVLVAGTSAEAVAMLEHADERRVSTARSTSSAGGIVFMFPGGGAQYPRMAQDIYRAEPVFARHVDAGLALLEERHGLDLRPILFCDDEHRAAAAVELERPSVQLPAIFLVEYALAQLVMEWGITPTVMLGHSVGENTAACIAGTMSFADCLGLVALRGQLMDMTPGGMAIVAMGPDELAPMFLDHPIDLAVVNAADLCVVSGEIDALESFERDVRASGVEPQRVRIGTAAHSRQLDPVLDRFRSYLEGIPLRAPRIPWVSNRTGNWITNEQAVDPGYWVDHLRHTVQFSACVATLAQDPHRIALEVGPGTALSSLVKLDPVFRKSQASLSTLGQADDEIDDNDNLLLTMGRLWTVGSDVGLDHAFLDATRDGGTPARIGLPTYAFQSQPFFLEPGRAVAAEDDLADDTIEREPDQTRWFWEPVWKHHDAPEPIDDPVSWLFFCDRLGIAEELVERLERRGDQVVTVRYGDAYAEVGERSYVLAAEEGRFGYDQLLRDLIRRDQLPDRVVHLSLLATAEDFRPGLSFFHRNQELGLYSTLQLAQAWASEGLSHPLHIVVATSGAQKVVPTDRVRWPEQSTVMGPARVIPHELANVTVSCIDLEPDDLHRPPAWRGAVDRLVDKALADRPGFSSHALGRRARAESLRDVTLRALHREILAPPSCDLVAVRNDRRLVRSFRRSIEEDPATSPIAEGAVVLMTGGLGGIGLTLARHLASVAGVRLVLLSRAGLPDRQDWGETVRRFGPHHPTSARIIELSALEAAGAEVLLMTGDVTDVDRVRFVVGEITNRYGTIDWVIHAAGVVDDALLAVKSQAEIERVLAPKLYGTVVLDEVTRDIDLRGFVVFSSTSTITGPPGQVDYVAANAFLESFVQSRNGRRGSSDARYRAVSWGPWKSVGMTSASSTHHVPPRLSSSEPWFSAHEFSEEGVVRLFSTWSTDGQWFLDEHRTIAGDALLPGAAYLELARQALAEIGEDRGFELRDLAFLHPLGVADETKVEVLTRLTPTEIGYRLDVNESVVVGDTVDGIETNPRSGWRRSAESGILIHEMEAPPCVDLDALWRRCTVDAPTRTRQQDHLSFGDRWNVVRRVRLGERIALADLELDESFSSDLATVHLHPALIDLSTGFAMDLIEGYSGDTLWVPVGYHRVRVFDRLPSRVVACASLRGNSTEMSGTASFDVTIADVQGRVLVEIDGFAIRKLDIEAHLGLNRRVLPADVEFDVQATVTGSTSPAAAALATSIERGITAEEGSAAFDRVIARTASSIVVSPFDPDVLVRQTEAVARQQTRSTVADSGTLFSRPFLESEYVEPRTELERSIVGLWQELLGVDQVGVRDSFFDLGGHSIIAVRFFAKLKRLYGVDFPLSVLLGSPTIEECAALVDHALHPNGVDSETAASGAMSGADAPARTYLVAMHPGDDPNETPFFLAAGMFGNIMNLRHLANQIGTSRPFYGIQARGLFGGDAPHETFEEMAEAYLTEIRDVQPHGPYVLGGFSGGGVVAFEMARQLRRAGEPVALLVMLDTPAPLPKEHLAGLERAQVQVDNIRRHGAGYITTWASNRYAWEREKRRRRSEPENLSTETLHSPVIEAAFYRALARYELRPYDGVITLFRPKLRPAHVFSQQRQVDDDRNFLYDDNRWSGFCRRVDVTEVSGSHDSMVLEPNVRLLAARMDDAIVAAQTASHRRIHGIGSAGHQ